MCKEKSYFTDYIPVAFQNKTFIQEWKNYIDYRISIDKRFKKQAAKLLCSKLMELTGGNTEKAIQLMQKSIINGWKSVYPDKEYNGKNNLSNKYNEKQI